MYCDCYRCPTCWLMGYFYEQASHFLSFTTNTERLFDSDVLHLFSNKGALEFHKAQRDFLKNIGFAEQRKVICIIYIK